MTTCYNQTHWSGVFQDYFSICCGVPSVLLNALVLYIAWRHVDMRAKLNQLFVVNMTVSDFIYGLVYMTTKMFVGCFPNWLCACYYVVVWTCQIGSVFFLLFLNIDKFISLSTPLHYHVYVTERCVHLTWTLFWTVPIGYSLFTYFGPVMTKPDPNVECVIALSPIYYATAIIVFYIVPLTISASISVYIYVLVRKKTRWNPSISDSQACERRRVSQALFKRIFFVFSSTLWSTLTILPYRLAYCIYTFACSQLSSRELTFDPTVSPAELTTSTDGYYRLSDRQPLTSSLGPDAQPNSLCTDETVQVLISVLFCLPPLGAVGNPLITIVTQRLYRTRALDIWAGLLRLLRIRTLLPGRNNSSDTVVDELTCSMVNGLGSTRSRRSLSAREPRLSMPLLPAVCRSNGAVAPITSNV